MGQMKRVKNRIKPIIAILLDIRSAHNVGSIFRTADALGIQKIYLTGYTPAPIDRFGRAQKEVVKTALGAEKNIKWESFSNMEKVVNKLKKEKISLVAVEQGSKSKDYKKYRLSKTVAFIFGNEINGVPKKVLGKCDEIISIPMRGKKESLNVAVAFGISMARILNL